MQRGEHAVDIEAVVGTDVGVVLHAQAGGGEQGFVDRPGGIAQPDAAPWQAFGDELAGQAQRAGAARRLGAAGALLAEGNGAAAEHLTQQ